MKYPDGSLAINSYAWLIVCHLSAFAIGFCLYGDNDDCAFQCHCSQKNECSGGICPSGCESGALGYNWRGPACQIGNIGLKKSASMTADDYFQRQYPAVAALDGVEPGKISSKCAHPRNQVGIPAEWWADLGVVHKIYNITIYGRTDCCEKRLQQFDLTVYNTSDNEVLCAYVSDTIFTYRTIECQTPVIGRYVHFKRQSGYKIHLTTLCEVVIIGHKYIDCSDCPPDAQCNDITGCDQCVGSYQPDCKQECGGGFYGTNCQQQCGHCKTGTLCDRKTGRCPEGCQIWWTDSKCTTFIDLPQRRNETVRVQHITSNSIEVQWQHIGGIISDFSEFYGYLIEYKAEGIDDNYTVAGLVSYDSAPYWKIQNLEANTQYYIKITAFKQYDEIKQFGHSYDLLAVKTDSAEESTDVVSWYLPFVISVVFNGVFIAVIVLLTVIYCVLRRIPSEATSDKSRRKETAAMYSMRNAACGIDEETPNKRSLEPSQNEINECDVIEKPTMSTETCRQRQDADLVQYEKIKIQDERGLQDGDQYEGLVGQPSDFYENAPSNR